MKSGSEEVMDTPPHCGAPEPLNPSPPLINTIATLKPSSQVFLKNEAIKGDAIFFLDILNNITGNNESMIDFLAANTKHSTLSPHY